MNSNHITTLMEKFMAGQTSLEEEALLADIVRRCQVAPEGISKEDWNTYREMFALFDTGMNEVPTTKSKPRRTWHLAALVAAASVAIILAIGTLWVHDREQMLPVASTQLASADTTQKARVTPEATLNPDSTLQLKAKTGKKLRNTLPVYRNYIAKSSSSAVSEKSSSDSIARINDALRQTELLLQAIYIQQQAEIESIEAQQRANIHRAALTTIDYEPEY